MKTSNWNVFTDRTSHNQRRERVLIIIEINIFININITTIWRQDWSVVTQAEEKGETQRLHFGCILVCVCGSTQPNYKFVKECQTKIVLQEYYSMGKSIIAIGRASLQEHHCKTLLVNTNPTFVNCASGGFCFGFLVIFFGFFSDFCISRWNLLDFVVKLFGFLILVQRPKAAKTLVEDIYRA